MMNSLMQTCDHVPSGSTIYSDGFATYFSNRTAPPTSHLEPYGYTHFTINHSQHFVSEIDSTIHTNTIERLWRTLKEKFKHNKPRTGTDKHIAELCVKFESERRIGSDRIGSLSVCCAADERLTG